jgi:hypothetical protein
MEIFEYEELDKSRFGLGATHETDLTSEYLVFVLRFGIAGFLLVWLIWGLFISKTAHSILGKTDSTDRTLGTAAFLTMMAAIISAIGILTILAPPMMTIILVMVGITGRLKRAEKSSRPVVVLQPVELRQEALAPVGIGARAA